MREPGPNLAARPFANERPARRTTLLIWILALFLLAINVFLYQRHLSAHNEQRQALKVLEAQIEVEEKAVRQRQTELAAFGVEGQNRQVIFLNTQIAHRTFSWGHLFDRMEEVLPANVELRKVTPKIVQDEDRGERRREVDAADLVSIDMNGYAATDDDLLELVDNLFEHPSFTLPNLSGETDRDDGRLEFTLDVFYLPAAAAVENVDDPAESVEEAALVSDSTEDER